MYLMDVIHGRCFVNCTAHVISIDEHETSPCILFCSFGYVVEGSDFLSDIKEGDVIVSAKVTKGLENLVDPKA